MSAFSYLSSSALTQKQDSVISWGLIFKREKPNLINGFYTMERVTFVDSKTDEILKGYVKHKVFP